VGFLQDYVGIFPAVIAVTNGALAVFSAHYPFRTPRAKAAFIVCVITLSLAAISTTFYSQYLLVHQKNLEQERRAFVRSHLQDFYISGGNLLSRPIPRDVLAEDFQRYVGEFSDWLNQTANWILANYGKTSGIQVS
jgi:hypothetical protein